MIHVDSGVITGTSNNNINKISVQGGRYDYGCVHV